MNSNRNKNKRRDFRGDASLYIRLSVVSTVVCGLDSQSQPSLSSSQDNVSFSVQLKRVSSNCEKIHKTSSPTHCEQIFSGRAYEFFRVVLGSADKGRKRPNRDSLNSLRKDWVCCVINGIMRYAFFFFLFHTEQ